MDLFQFQSYMLFVAAFFMLSAACFYCITVLAISNHCIQISCGEGMFVYVVMSYASVCVCAPKAYDSQFEWL